MSLTLHVFLSVTVIQCEFLVKKKKKVLKKHLSILGPPEYGALCRPEQPNKASPAVPPVDRPHNGGVLPPRRPREGARHGDKSDV